MQLSKNLNPYWVFFSLFFKFASNFKHFQKKKDNSHNLCTSEITDCERHG